MAYDLSDPPSPLKVVRIALGTALAVASLPLVASCVATGSFDWHLWGLAGLLWLIWAAFEDIVTIVVRPLGGFVTRTFSAGLAAAPLGTAAPPISIDDETTFLEHLVADPPTGHREMIAGIRLAEIYRTHQHDEAKAAALLDRLRAKYPDAAELNYVRPRGDAAHS